MGVKAAKMQETEVTKSGDAASKQSWIKDKGWLAALILILICQTAVMIYFCNEKQGYHVDELYSYGLANSYYHPHVYSNGALDNRWVDGSYFTDYLEVQAGKQFQYGSVFYNQANDVHPPLFYSLLHTVCSLFPNTFSKWYGLSFNIIYFVIAELILYKIAYRMLNDRWKAMLPVLMYGFSAGAVCLVTYIRMYMLLTVWVLLFLDVHAGWIITGKVRKRDYAALSAAVFLGFFTHYYFLIFAFFISAFYCIGLMFTRRFKRLVAYAAAMLVPFVIMDVVYPYAYTTLLFSFRGTEAVRNLKEAGGWISALTDNWKTFGNEIFAGHQNIAAIIVLAALICLIINAVKSKKQEPQEPDMSAVFAVMVLSASAAYFLLVSRIAPYRGDRYYFTFYPAALLSALVIVIKGLELMRGLVPFKGSAVNAGVYACITVLIGAVSYAELFGEHSASGGYLYKNDTVYTETAEKYSGDNCIYISWQGYLPTQNVLELGYMKHVLRLYPDAISNLPNMLPVPKDSEMIVYVDTALDQDETMQSILEYSGYKEYEYLFTHACGVYRVY